MKTFDEFFNINILDGKRAEEYKKKIEAAEKEINDRLAEKAYVTRKEIWLHSPDDSKEDDSEEDDLPECEVKLEKAPDPAKEEIFATCLNFLHAHTEDELYEIVRLAFKAAEVFGY